MDLEFRPCGACNALVPTKTGCPHWKYKSNYRKDQRDRRNRRQERLTTKERIMKDMAQFYKQMEIPNGL